MNRYLNRFILSIGREDLVLRKTCKVGIGATTTGFDQPGGGGFDFHFAETFRGIV
jgi:hypothetical protein